MNAAAAPTCPARVEPMTAEHAAQVLAIYQAGIDEGDATFETRAPDWAEFDATRLPGHRFVALGRKAAQHGETLKDLFTRAIAHEVRGVSRSRSAGRLNFPLIGRDGEPKVEVTNADIDAAFEAEDLERYCQ